MDEFRIFDRELSWLSFNYRVLQEAKDPSVPLYERIKFLAIYSSNLDEFFRVRVASIRSLLDLKKKSTQKLKFDPKTLLKKIHTTVHKQQTEFGEIFRSQIIPELNKNKIFLVNENNLTKDQKEFVWDYFNENIKPLIQPIIIIKKKISLFLQNKSIYLAVKLQPVTKKKESKKYIRYKYSILEIPSNTLSRFVSLPEKNGENYIMFLDDVIRASLQQIFPGYDIVESYSVKLTRDAELYIDDEFSGNLLEKIKKSINKRKTGVPSRFLYDSAIPKDFLKILKDAVSLSKNDLIPGGRYHNFNDFFSFPNPIGSALEYEPMPPLSSKEFDKHTSTFDAIKEQDIMLHYPYQSFDYVLKFIEEAAFDDAVRSIKITLYRTASNSRVIRALIDAANNGKSVTAFIEVKARFDEELNFQNAEELEKAGVKVLYSVPGLKVHSKICLVSRVEPGEKKYYAYLATGNFNEKTARIYSDIGVFTCDNKITKEVREIFYFLSRKKEKLEFENILVAPFNLRETFNKLIDNEIKNVKEGKKASITIKLNSIEDRKIIKKLYEASNAGVNINLIVRGICCMVPGLKGMSKNIKARSIVDRFLEHTRIYIFHNNGDEKYFLSSADWMNRNLSRRIELCFPVYDEKIKSIIKDIISIQMCDNTKARLMNSSQNNKYINGKDELIRAQYATYDYFKTRNKVQRDISIAIQ